MKRILLLFILLVLISIDIFGQTIPKQINYQGILKDAAGNLLTGDYALTFKIYNEPTGGAPLWTEIQVLSVTNGLFNTQLGGITSINGVPFDRTHFLGIQVGTGAELTPRTMLTPSPYSFMSMNIIDNTVVKSLNSLKDNVNLVAGSNITITPSGNNLTISAGGTGGIIGGSGTVNYFPIFTDATTLGNSKLFQNNDGDVQVGNDGVRTQLTLSANDNINEGGQINWNGGGNYDDWYQDLALHNMRIRSNSANNNFVEIFNNSTGTTGLLVEGEIQSQRTGGANMVPIAYGTISSAGTKYNGCTDNFTVTRVSTGNYQINIDDGGFYFQNNVVTCAVYGSDLYFITYYDVGTTLGFKIWNSSGVLANREFNFVVYKK